MRIFTNKRFSKFASKEGIEDAKLREAVREAEAGKIDADYGGGVIKQRIPRSGEGKSGGYRCVILYRHADKAFFVYGFPKNARENIDKTEERAFKELAKITLAFSDQEIRTLVKTGAYKEVKSNG
jgi:hypothetical protein